MSRHVFVATTDAVYAAIAADTVARSDSAHVVSDNAWLLAYLRRDGIPALDTVPYLRRADHVEGSAKLGQIQHLVESQFNPGTHDGLKDTHVNRLSFWLRESYRYLVRLLLTLENLHLQCPRAIWHVPTSLSAMHPKSALVARYCRIRDIQTEPLAISGTNPDTYTAVAPQRGWRALTDKLAVRLYKRALIRAGATLLVATPAMHMRDLARFVHSRHPDVRPILLRYQRRSAPKELALASFWSLAPRWTLVKSDKLMTIDLPLLQPEPSLLASELQESISAFLRRHQSALDHRDMPLGELILSHKHVILQHMANSDGPAQAYQFVFEHAQPQLLLSPTCGQVYHMIGEMARNRGIPAVVVPFKSIAPPHGPQEASGSRQIGADMLTNIYAFAVAQSPLIADYASYSGYSGRVVLSPPLLRSRVNLAQRQALRQHLSERVGPFDKLVLYAPSMKLCGPLFVVHTLDEVFRCMSDLIAATSDQPGTKLMIRLHPDLSTLGDNLAHLIDIRPHVIIDAGNQDSFAQVLPMADLLVTNMSTVAEEAIGNHIPVLAYDPWNRHNHLNAPRIRDSIPESLSPAYYLSERSALGGSMAWLLSHHPPQLHLPAGAYAPYLHDESVGDGLMSLIDNFLA